MRNDFATLSEDQRFSRLCSEAGLRVVEVGQFFYALPPPRREEHQSVCRVETLPRDQKRTKIKGWIQSSVRFGPVSDMKVCDKYGKLSVEVQVQSLFRNQIESWIRIVNGVDKLVKEVIPIQGEEKASVKSAAKARRILKPSSTSGWDSVPMEQRKSIDIVKYRNPRVLVVSKCQNSLFDWSIAKWVSVLAKGGLFESEISSEILVPSSNPRTFRKYNQSCIARQCTVTRRFRRVHLSRRKRKRIEVNSESWFDSRRSQSQNRDKLCFSLL